MGMTPQQIQEKHFHDSFRGYSHEEVDQFLDEVAEAFERMFRENQSLQRRSADLEVQLRESAVPRPAAQPASGPEDDSVSEKMLKRMLVMAQETADKAVQEARTRARELEDQAKGRADAMINQAEGRLRDLTASTIEKEQDLSRIQSALDRFENEYRSRFKQFVDSQLEALGQLSLSSSGQAVGLEEFSIQNPVATPDVEIAAVEVGEATSAFDAVEPKLADAEENLPKHSGPNDAPISKPTDSQAPNAGATEPSGAADQSESSKKEKARKPKDDDELIKELFWGEE